MSTIAARVPALAATALLAACAFRYQDTVNAPPNVPLPPANVSAAVASREALAKVPGRPDIPFTGNPDQDFAVNMVPQHQAAIELAEMELKYGRDPAMRRIAEQIVRKDAASKSQLTAWLQNHPVPQQPGPMLAMP